MYINVLILSNCHSDPEHSGEESLGRKLVIAAILVSVSFAIAACSKVEPIGLPYYNTPDFTPVWTSSGDTGNFHRIANFSFTDQDGRPVTNETLKGKIYVANFFFTTCPAVCPKMTSNLVKVQETFKNDSDVKLISHTVMPWFDSVNVLKSYEKRFDLKNGMWYLVTGSMTDVYSLARKSYFAEQEPGFNSDSTQFLHTEHILLVDRNGHLRGVYNGTLPLEINRLIEDIRILKKG